MGVRGRVGARVVLFLARPRYRANKKKTWERQALTSRVIVGHAKVGKRLKCLARLPFLETSSCCCLSQT